MKKITKVEATKNSTKRKLRVAAYARVSTSSDEQLVSLETQKAHYERHIKNHKDWEFAGLYYDEGISGTKMEKRDGLLQMLEDCDKGLIDYILVKSISRFSRNTVDSVNTVRRLCDKGIYIYFEKEKIDTGRMEGELLLSILSSLAESESYSNSQNNKWAVQKRFQNGTFKIGYPPYGYDNVNGKMVVNQAQAEIVRRIFNEVLSGKSADSVAKLLNNEGIPSRRNGKWAGGTILKMIKNEKYTGDVIFQKTFTDDQYYRHVNYGDYGKYYARGHHEAIVSHEIFEAANAVIKQNGSSKKDGENREKYSNRYVTTGKVRCGICGGPCKRVKVMGSFSFACKTHLQSKDTCPMKTVREESVKAAFVTMMNKLTWGRNTVLVPFSKMTKEENSAPKLQRVKELDSLLEKNMEKRRRILQFFTNELLEPAVYAKENDDLIYEASRFKSEKENILTQMKGSRGQQEALRQIMHYTAKGNILTEFDEDLFVAHVDHVIIYERTEIGFAMKCGPVFRERI